MSQVLPSAADKPRFVAQMFGRIARRYDLMNTLMTLGQDAAWRRAVADSVLSPQSSVLPSRPQSSVLSPHRASSILDVGTGTGKLAQALARRWASARVVGVDFAEPMLRAAPPGLRLAAADGLNLPFPDASFDGVASAFVMRNVADVAAAIAEQARVLRPGGRLVVLETTPGPRGALRPFFRVYFRQLVPLLGGLIAGDASAYTYLPESTLAFVEPERLIDLMREAGLMDMHTRRLAFGAVAITAARKPFVTR